MENLRDLFGKIKYFFTYVEKIEHVIKLRVKHNGNKLILLPNDNILIDLGLNNIDKITFYKTKIQKHQLLQWSHYDEKIQSIEVSLKNEIMNFISEFFIKKKIFDISLLKKFKIKIQDGDFVIGDFELGKVFYLIKRLNFITKDNKEVNEKLFNIFEKTLNKKEYDNFLQYLISFITFRNGLLHNNTIDGMKLLGAGKLLDDYLLNHNLINKELEVEFYFNNRTKEFLLKYDENNFFQQSIILTDDVQELCYKKNK